MKSHFLQKEIKRLTSASMFSGGSLLAQSEEFKVNRDPGALANPAEAYGLLGGLISNLLTLALFAGGMAALVFFIIGAIQWGSAASGDGAAKGRRTMIYAGAGLVMLGLVYVLILLYNSIIPRAE